ncbi:hypothetical protein CRM22_007371 [Opisthorchis felineus]|uniref:Uncharacterized protein n=1 Tax=Opisthorchis felineus TaxID=147828 RepID=A0A4S2LP09_OPIFE|nr:hypothetical protein CRM22_007371 [Opisthorchis felineus]
MSTYICRNNVDTRRKMNLKLVVSIVLFAQSLCGVYAVNNDLRKLCVPSAVDFLEALLPSSKWVRMVASPVY